MCRSNIGGMHLGFQPHTCISGSVLLMKTGNGNVWAGADVAYVMMRHSGTVVFDVTLIRQARMLEGRKLFLTG